MVNLILYTEAVYRSVLRNWKPQIHLYYTSMIDVSMDGIESDGFSIKGYSEASEVDLKEIIPAVVFDA